MNPASPTASATVMANSCAVITSVLFAGNRPWASNWADSAIRRSRLAAAISAVTSAMRTSKPASASTWAMPPPM